MFNNYTTYMVDTMIVGIKRKGITSKRNLESNHAVGLAMQVVNN
jgi:hypothetical protein